MVMTITGTTKAKMKTQIFVTVSQYQSGSGNFSMHMVLPGKRAGRIGKKLLMYCYGIKQVETDTGLRT